jgi:hypothetical protein
MLSKLWKLTFYSLIFSLVVTMRRKATRRDDLVMKCGGFVGPAKAIAPLCHHTTKADASKGT